MAPLPTGICAHFGPELRDLVLMQHHQSQVTVERLAMLPQASRWHTGMMPSTGANAGGLSADIAAQA